MNAPALSRFCPGVKITLRTEIMVYFLNGGNMGYSLDKKLVVGISSRALFDLEEENRIFETEGLNAYRKYQKEREHVVLKPGAGFRLCKMLSELEIAGEKVAEVIVTSRNSADTSLRIFNSIDHYGLEIKRAVLSGGTRIEPYLKTFKTDLFLSANEEDVQDAVNAGIAAGRIFPSAYVEDGDGIIRIAFDGDAVIFSDESEKIFKEKGLEAFSEHEKENAMNPLSEGPFAPFLKTISYIQKQFKEDVPIRTALVTARCAPAHERVIRTLDAWDVRVDEAFFLGGLDKANVLEAFGADIFFDDQQIHIDPASQVVPSARVPYRIGETND